MGRPPFEWLLEAVHLVDLVHCEASVTRSRSVEPDEVFHARQLLVAGAVMLNALDELVEELKLGLGWIVIVEVQLTERVEFRFVATSHRSVNHVRPQQVVIPDFDDVSWHFI